MSTKNFSQSLADGVELVLFVHLGFDSGSIRIHSGVGKLIWGGNDWLGLGDLGTIKMKEGVDIKPTKATLTLSKVNQEFMNDALYGDTEGRVAEIYVGVIGTNGLVSGTPDLLLAGTMGSPVIDMESGLISLEVEDFRSRLYLRNGKKFTIEDHQEDFAGDKFFEFLPEMLDHRFVFNGTNLGQNNLVPSTNNDSFDDDWYIEG